MKNLLETKLNISTDSIIENELAVELATKWHNLFCPKRIDWVKNKPKNTFRWENVSREIEGDEAIKLYESQKARTYFIMPEEFGFKNSTMYQTESIPKYDDYLLDFYVFPKNMAWTMAFSHESGPKMMNLGPMFIKHKNFKILQKKNEESYNAKDIY